MPLPITWTTTAAHLFIIEVRAEGMARKEKQREEEEEVLREGRELGSVSPGTIKITRPIDQDGGRDCFLSTPVDLTARIKKRPLAANNLEIPTAGYKMRRLCE